MSYTKSHLVEALRNEMAVSNTEAKQLLNLIFDEVADYLKDGRNVNLPRFGNFVLSKKTARIGRNPRTGDIVAIPPRSVISFRPSRKLKKHINNNVGPE